jgi:hypothetical protein
VAHLVDAMKFTSSHGAPRRLFDAVWTPAVREIVGSGAAGQIGRKGPLLRLRVGRDLRR